MTDAASIEHPTELTGGDFTAADEPLRLFAAWFAEAERASRSIPNAMTLATVDRRRPAQCAHGAVEGLRRARLRLLHEPRQREGPGIERDAEGGADVLLEVAAAPGARARRASSRSRRRRPTPISPPRSRMAQIGAWASKQSAPLESRLAFEKAVALYTAKFGDRRRAAAAALVGLSHRAAGDRVLAGAAVPPARPHRVHPLEHRPRRGARRGSIRKHHDIGARSKATDEPIRNSRRTVDRFASPAVTAQRNRKTRRCQPATSRAAHCF